MDIVGYVEAVPCNFSTPKWKHISVNIGAAQSTLQDVKFPETSGAYEYKDSKLPSSPCRNRFIYWRIKQDIIEVTEQSFDCNLNGNYVRFQFEGTAVLEGGVSLHETKENVIVLVATVASVHRLVFPHPNSLSLSEFSSYQSDILPSIFYEASVRITRDQNHFYVINNGGVNSGIAVPQTAASCLSVSTGEAYFALAHANGTNILLIILGCRDTLGQVSTFELEKASVMKKLWSGIVPSVIRGEKENEEAPLSMFIHAINNEMHLFALCRDCKIRIWSCNSQQLLATAAVFPPNSNGLQIGAQKHVLRKHIGVDSNGSLVVVLAVFLCFADQKMVCILKPVKDGPSYDVQTVATLHLPAWDLIDLSLTSNQLWAMWSGPDCQPVIKYINFQSKGQNIINEWRDVILETSGGQRPYLADGLEDPRQAYLHQIFNVMNFSAATINKAINIYKKSMDVSMITTEVAQDALMHEVIAVIENDIQMQTSDYELVDDVYLEIQHESWSKFYSCCLEYHQVGMTPTGMKALASSGLTIVIKKGCFTVLRPADVIEHLVHANPKCINADIISTSPAISQDGGVYKALVHIMRCVRTIDDNLSDEIKDAFEHDVYHLQTPQKVGATVLNAILCPSNVSSSNVPRLVEELGKEQCSSSNLVNGMSTIIHMLDFDVSHIPISKAECKVTDQLVYTQWLSGDLGINTLCDSIERMAQARFQLCRDLLLLQLVLVDHANHFQLTSSDIDEIQSKLIPQTSLFVHACFTLLWSCRANADSTKSINNQSEVQQLAVLDLADRQVLKGRFDGRVGVLELYIQGEGGKLARRSSSEAGFKKNCDSSIGSYFVAVARNIGGLIWPICYNFCFPEFLMLNFQHLQIQQYVRLLHTWCEINYSSRKFLLGFSLLNQGEHDKAVDCFLIAVRGIASKEMLFEKLLKVDLEDEFIGTLYYLKVIHLLEQLNVADHILTVANAAVAAAHDSDPNIITLQSIIFKYHLELGHFDEAYAAMNSICDSSAKKDCLRQFVVVLCEKSQLKTLLSYPYNDLYDEIVSIMEARARSVDIRKHNYYDIIYSFHIFRENYRKAGSIMYEYGMRLACEYRGIKDLQEQVKCYLAAINCLSLVNPKYAWIVKPQSNSSKSEKSGKTKVEVLELEDINKEYKHATAILYLIRKCPHNLSSLCSMMTVSETIALLTSEGLFDMAITLCTEYGLSYTPIFESLASKSLKITHKPDELSIDEMGSDWNWVAYNELPDYYQAASNLSGVEQAWNLLKYYLETLEKDGQSVYHRCIATKLLSVGFNLPVWLISSYKKRNPAELIRLYLLYNQLYEAGYLSIEYIDAVMGKGSDHFNPNNKLDAVGSTVWMPYTAFDQLISSLKRVQADVILQSLHRELDDKLRCYQQMVTRTSEHIIQRATIITS